MPGSAELNAGMIEYAACLTESDVLEQVKSMDEKIRKAKGKKERKHTFLSPG